jgi:hypothetical protein
MPGSGHLQGANVKRKQPASFEGRCRVQGLEPNRELYLIRAPGTHRICGNSFYMPFYHLRVEDGEPITDTIPIELADDEAARREAEAVARELSQGRCSGSEWKVVVTNENGRTVAEVPAKWMIVGRDPSDPE